MVESEEISLNLFQEQVTVVPYDTRWRQHIAEIGGKQHGLFEILGAICSTQQATAWIHG